MNKFNTNNIKFVEAERTPKKTNKSFWSILAIFFGIFIGMIILSSFIGMGATSTFFTELYQSSFQNLNSVGRLFGVMSWMIFLGLAMAVSFKAKLFNIGVSAQMVGGGLFGYMFATTFDIGRGGVVFSVLIPMFVGMTIAWFIGWLKVRFSIHEVISSIMLNWIIFYLYKLFTSSGKGWSWMPGSVSNPIYQNNSLRTENLTSMFNGSDVNVMFFVGLVVVVILALVYSYTKWGVKQKIVGNSLTVAQYAGIKREKEIMRAMMLSGALAGLAGAAYYLGVKENLPSLSTDLPAEAFTGISIALIGFSSPIGVLGATLFMGMMQNAAPALKIATGPSNAFIIDVINGVIIWFIALTNYFIIYKPHLKWKIFNPNLREAAMVGEIDQSSKNKWSLIKWFEKMQKGKTYGEIDIPIGTLNNDLVKVFDDFYKTNVSIRLHSQNDLKNLSSNKIEKIYYKDFDILMEKENLEFMKEIENKGLIISKPSIAQDILEFVVVNEKLINKKGKGA